MKYKFIILIVLLISLAVIILPKILKNYNNEYPAPYTQTTNDNDRGNATITINPNAQKVKSGDSFDFDVVINPEQYSLTGIDVSLKYDPEIFEITSLIPSLDVSVLDQTVLNKIDNDKGKINYAVFTLDKTKAINATSLRIITVNGKVKEISNSGLYSIEFDSSTSASATSETINVISKETQNAEIEIY